MEMCISLGPVFWMVLGIVLFNLFCWICYKAQGGGG